MKGQKRADWQVVGQAQAKQRAEMFLSEKEKAGSLSHQLQAANAR